MKILCMALLVTVQCRAFAQQMMKVEEAWQMVQRNYLPLQLKGKDVEMAIADRKQEQLWDNPEISISHNINNPVTHRYFEMNRDGETDVQLSQRIYIGGQRNERVRKATANLHRTEYEQADAQRLMRRELSQLMVNLASLQQKMAVIDKEIDSASKILKAYEEQLAKGNVAAVEVVRIRSQRIQLLQEKTSLCNDIHELQQQLRLMTGWKGTNGADGKNTADATDAPLAINPDIDYNATVALLATTNKPAILKALDSRADLLADQQDIASAYHDVKLQKANALPELNITGEWDKNGNIGHNYFAVGVSLSLPLFNRNQGGRKSAAAALDAKQMQQEWNKREAQSEIERNWDKLMLAQQMAQEMSKHLEGDNEQMMAQMETQYLRHNISLLELLDYYETYKENHYLAIESKRDVLLAMTELDLEIK